jgi:hypothetical protein
MFIIQSADRPRRCCQLRSRGVYQAAGGGGGRGGGVRGGLHAVRGRHRPVAARQPPGARESRCVDRLLIERFILWGAPAFVYSHQPASEAREGAAKIGTMYKIGSFISPLWVFLLLLHFLNAYARRHRQELEAALLCAQHVRAALLLQGREGLDCRVLASPIAPLALIHSRSVLSTCQAQFLLNLSPAAADGQSDSPQGVIMLERSTTGDGDEAKRAHAFSLVTPLRTFLFSCDSDAERDEWRKVCHSLPCYLIHVDLIMSLSHVVSVGS